MDKYYPYVKLDNLYFIDVKKKWALLSAPFIYMNQPFPPQNKIRKKTYISNPN